MRCTASPVLQKKAVRDHHERRNQPRLPKQFQTTLKIVRTAAEIKGVTLNISQGGAFISSASFPSVKEKDEAIVQLFLPPEMTGQRDVLMLTGQAIVKRVDKTMQGIAVQFQKELRTFEPSI